MSTTEQLDFSIKIGTQPSLSQFDQSLVISCLNYHIIIIIIIIMEIQKIDVKLQDFSEKKNFFFMQNKAGRFDVDNGSQIRV